MNATPVLPQTGGSIVACLTAPRAGALSGSVKQLVPVSEMVIAALKQLTAVGSGQHVKMVVVMVARSLVKCILYLIPPAVAILIKIAVMKERNVATVRGKGTRGFVVTHALDATTMGKGASGAESAVRTILASLPTMGVELSAMFALLPDYYLCLDAKFQFKKLVVPYTFHTNKCILVCMFTFRCLMLITKYSYDKKNPFYKQPNPQNPLNQTIFRLCLILL